MIGTIVVGIDGSSNATRALDWAIELARAVDAEIVAVHAVGLLEGIDRGVIEREFEARWCHPLDGTGLRNRRVLRDGTPAMAVMRAAAEFDADLIVLGRRGTSGVTSLLLGSTSTEVVHGSPTPVTIVPLG